MAKVKIKNVQAVRKLVGARFKIAINKLLRNKDIRSKVGKIVVDDIRSRKFAAAGDVTKAFRKYFEQFNQTHPNYNRNIINITFTGELLNDLASNVKANTTKLELVIEHSDKKHKLYKVAKRRKKKAVRRSHKEISEFVLAKGYDYLTISDKASKKITRLIQDELFNLLK